MVLSRRRERAPHKNEILTDRARIGRDPGEVLAKFFRLSTSRMTKGMFVKLDSNASCRRPRSQRCASPQDSGGSCEMDSTLACFARNAATNLTAARSRSRQVGFPGLKCWTSPWKFSLFGAIAGLLQASVAAHRIGIDGTGEADQHHGCVVPAGWSTSPHKYSAASKAMVRTPNGSAASSITMCGVCN